MNRIIIEKPKHIVAIVFTVILSVAFVTTVYAQGLTRSLPMNQRMSGTTAGEIHPAGGGADVWLFSNNATQRIRINIQHNDANSAQISTNPGPNDRYDPTGFTLKINNGTTYPVVTLNTNIYVELPAGFNLFEIYSAKYCVPDATYTIHCSPA